MRSLFTVTTALLVLAMPARANNAADDLKCSGPCYVFTSVEAMEELVRAGAIGGLALSTPVGQRETASGRLIEMGGWSASQVDLRCPQVWPWCGRFTLRKLEGVFRGRQRTVWQLELGGMCPGIRLPLPCVGP